LQRRRGVAVEQVVAKADLHTFLGLRAYKPVGRGKDQLVNQ